MNPELQKKSLTDLRTMAQAFGITEIFEKDAAHLIQEIELKQVAMIPPPVVIIPRPPYDARLMTERPRKISSPAEIANTLEPYVRLGLKLSFEDESWTMVSGKKSDSGSLRMPLRDIMGCADRVLR